jgi:hypothetical protein
VTESSGKHVLITFGRSFLTLNLARLMSAAGHRVTIVDSLPIGITRFSHATSAFFRVPSPKFEPVAYCRRLVQIAVDEKVDMIIPIHEETDILSMMAELFLSPFATEKQLHQKAEFSRLLQEKGLPGLKYATLSSPEDVAALDFTTPFALKRVYSRGSQKVYKVAPGDDLSWLEFEDGNPWLAQQWASGARYCTYSVCRDGEVLAHAAYPVGYAIDGNSCLRFESVGHPGILNWVTEFVADVGFTGNIGFDFYDDPDIGLLTIECNPRATSGIMLFAAQDGIDRAFFGETTELITPRPDVDKMIGLGMLLYGWRRKSLNGRKFRDFVRDFRHSHDVVWASDDRRPALMLPLAYLYILRHCLKYKVGLAEGFMHDHEWDGKEIIIDG